MLQTNLLKFIKMHLKTSNTPGALIIEGHVQGLANTRALGKEGIPVIVVDVHQCVAASSKYCVDFIKCPPFLSDEFADFLFDLGVNKNLKGWVLIPSNDHAVYTLSKHKIKLQSIFKFAVPDILELDNIYDKVKLLKIAEKENVPIPKTNCFSSFDDITSDITFPVITKGRNGLSFYKSMGKKAFLSSGEEEFRQHLSEIVDKISLAEIFSQELLPFDGTNKTISFTAFCIDGEIKTYWMGAKLREHPLQFGTATFTESVFIDDCLQQSKRLLSTLKYTGICEVEYLQDPRDKKYKLIEINARSWLWVGHAIANGINFPIYLYNYLNGIDTHYPKDYAIGLKWRNPFSDTVYSVISILKKVLSIKDWRTQSKGEVVSALWDKDDKKPFYKYGKLMFIFFKNR